MTDTKYTLLRLNPFIDNDSILRVNGRLNLTIDFMLYEQKDLAYSGKVNVILFFMVNMNVYKLISHHNTTHYWPING